MTCFILSENKPFFFSTGRALPLPEKSPEIHFDVPIQGIVQELQRWSWRQKRAGSTLFHSVLFQEMIYEMASEWLSRS